MKHIKTFESFSYVNEELDLKKVGGAIKAGASAVGGAIKRVAASITGKLSEYMKRWNPKVKAEAEKIAPVLVDAINNKENDPEFKRRYDALVKAYLDLKNKPGAIDELNNFIQNPVVVQQEKLMLEGMSAAKITTAIGLGAMLTGFATLAFEVLEYTKNMDMSAVQTPAAIAAGVALLGGLIAGIGKIAGSDIK
jgi:hypothetical protein